MLNYKYLYNLMDHESTNQITLNNENTSQIKPQSEHESNPHSTEINNHISTSNNFLEESKEISKH